MKSQKDKGQLRSNIGFFASVSVFITYILGGIRWTPAGILAGIMIGIFYPAGGTGQRKEERNLSDHFENNFHVEKRHAK